MTSSPGAPTDLVQLQEALAGVLSVEREIGRGGMATVYLARDVTLDRPVALKVLHPELAALSEPRARFLREARTGARLAHPNITPIFSVEEQGEYVYFVMGLIDGETLGHRIQREGPVPQEEAERILRDVGWALGYAHAMGIVHRDVTLENILLERSSGRALLADFGIAAEIERGDDGPLLGTPAYLAPEIIQGEVASPQSDIYALGIVTWAMLSGRLPFIADDSAGVLLLHLGEELPSLARAAPATSSQMIKAVNLALKKDSAQRPESVEAWIAMLSGDAALPTLAFPLQRWLGSWDSAKPFYAMACVYMALGMYHTSLFWSNRTLLTLVSALFGRAEVALILAAVIHLGLALRQLRLLTQAGYGLADIQLAIARSRTELRNTPRRQIGLLPRLVHWARPTALLTYFVLGLAVTIPRSILRGDLHVSSWYLTLSLLFSWSQSILWPSLAFSLLIPGTHSSPDGWLARARQAFWHSRAGAMAVRIASVGTRRLTGSESTLHRPTELVLDLAIDDLYHALPPTTRRRMKEVPRLAERLRRRVAEVKELQQLVGRSAGSSDTAAALRERLELRHEAGVTALERLRLMLGKLGSTVQTEGELTLQLEAARGVERELLHELGAHASLTKMLRKGGRITPMMTPA